MNKPFLYIILSLFLITACGTEKEVIKQPTVSKTDHPYIQAFHEGLRFKTKGRLDEAIAKLEYCLTVRTDDDAVYYALSKLESIFFKVLLNAAISLLIISVAKLILVLFFMLFKN